MTDIKTFPLTYEIIERLFQTAVCLSYNPTEPMSAWQYAKQIQADFMKINAVKRCRLVSKTAKLWQRSYHPRFHYFSDGSLLFPRYLKENGAPQELENILRLLKIRGYNVVKIYAPQEQIDFFAFDKMLRYVSEQAWQHYPYVSDLTVEPFPSKEKFVAECFTDNNILLTASKDENVEPSCRKYLALFADGRFFVSDSYKMTQTSNFAKITQFENEHQAFLRMQLEYVPQDYIEALYAKAAEYNWFESPEDAMQKQKLSFNELIKMQKYIENLFQNRKCISVLNPYGEHVLLKPELDKYALFSDDLLLISNNRTNFSENSVFMEQMREIYPNHKFRTEQVPDYYFQEIYRRLPEFQKGATEIYIEMLKQKARKLKRMTDLTHIQALDAVAQMAGWQNWRAIKIESETHARHLIYNVEFDKQMFIKHHPDNPLEAEYKYWQRRHKTQNK